MVWLLTPVAMATKFDTDKIGSMYRRSPRSFRLIGVQLMSDINPGIILKDLKEQ